MRGDIKKISKCPSPQQNYSLLKKVYVFLRHLLYNNKNNKNNIGEMQQEHPQHNPDNNTLKANLALCKHTTTKKQMRRFMHDCSCLFIGISGRFVVYRVLAKSM